MFQGCLADEGLLELLNAGQGEGAPDEEEQ